MRKKRKTDVRFFGVLVTFILVAVIEGWGAWLQIQSLIEKFRLPHPATGLFYDLLLIASLLLTSIVAGFFPTLIGYFWIRKKMSDRGRSLAATWLAYRKGH